MYVDVIKSLDADYSAIYALPTEGPGSPLSRPPSIGTSAGLTVTACRGFRGSLKEA